MTGIGRSTTYHRLTILLLILIGAGVALALPGRTAAQDEPTPVPTPAIEEGAPVIVNGETVFRVSDPAGFESATERATAIAANIDRLATNPFIAQQPLTIIDTEDATEVVAGDELLFTITDIDAEAAGQPRLTVAQDAATAVQNAIVTGKTENDSGALIGRIALLLLASVIFVGLVWVINRVYAWFYQHLLPDTPRSWAPNRLTSTEFYRSGRLARMLKVIISVLRTITILVLFFFYLPFVFQIFPLTERWGDRIFVTITSVLGLMWDGFFDFLPTLVFIVIVGLVTYAIARGIDLFFREVARQTIRLPHFDPEWSRMTAALLSFLISIIAFIIVLGTLPIGESRALAGVLAFTGLLITLSSSSAIANIIAGVVLTYTNAIHTGDIVSVGATSGQVMSKSLLTTRVRTFKNEIVTLPNAMVLSGAITNYSRLADTHQLVIHTAVTIGYDVAWAEVHSLLRAAAAETDGILAAPAPFILQKSLGDFSVAYELNAHTSFPERMPQLLSALNRAILDQFNAAGIEILSPVYSAVRDGNKLTLPVEYLPEGYAAPAIGQQARARLEKDATTASPSEGG